MCGIVGFTTPGQDPAAAKQIVQGMADLIRHRGPDGEGCYADGTAALGHRRLSVIDLAGGGQPMLNEDGTLVVVFNGEIYNYKTLRARLQQRGHTFATDSDTEVLLHGYEEWGRALPCRLRGMFAFAVWDRTRGTLFCARDLFGIKPLCYYKKGETLLFASEIKAFLAHPAFEKRLNEARLPDWLSMEYLPDAETLFTGVYELPPAHTLTWQAGRVTLARYAAPRFRAKRGRSLRAWAREIGDAVAESADAHRIADVEVGCFLSGGVDSSLITCEMARRQPAVQCFSVGYAEEAYSELPAARAAAQALGVPLKVERGNRVFPVSDRSFDISGALERELRRLHVRLLRERAAAITVENSVVTGVDTDRQHRPADAVVLATGGVSYPGTGSTGDGYTMAAALGHTIVPPRGSLVPLESDDADCAAMQGLSLRNVEATVYNGKHKPVFREFGEMLFTHFGVSGPLMLSASAHLRRWDKEQYTLSIDLKPALDEQKLDARILRDVGENPNRDMANILSGLVHRSMVPVLLRRLALPEGEKANSLTKEQRRRLVQELKHFTVSLTGPRPVAEAIVTAGGIKVGEVVPNTMASKLVEGLYFAGEVLDVDAYTGGFNLQIAWATGYLAGLSAAER